MKIFIAGHGDYKHGSGEVFVPQNCSVHFYSDVDQQLLFVNGMAAVNAGHIKPLHTNFQGSQVENYSLVPFTDVEAARELASVSSRTGKIYLVGMNAPFDSPPISLCTTRGKCRPLALRAPRHLAQHDPSCQGLFNLVRRSLGLAETEQVDIHLLACRVRSDKPDPQTFRSADDSGGMRHVDTVRGLAASILQQAADGDRRAALARLDRLPQGTQAQVVTYPELSFWLQQMRSPVSPSATMEDITTTFLPFRQMLIDKPEDTSTQLLAWKALPPEVQTTGAQLNDIAEWLRKNGMEVSRAKPLTLHYEKDRLLEQQQKGDFEFLWRKTSLVKKRALLLIDPELSQKLGQWQIALPPEVGGAELMQASPEDAIIYWRILGKPGQVGMLAKADRETAQRLREFLARLNAVVPVTDPPDQFTAAWKDKASREAFQEWLDTSKGLSRREKVARELYERAGDIVTPDGDVWQIAQDIYKYLMGGNLGSADEPDKEIEPLIDIPACKELGQILKTREKAQSAAAATIESTARAEEARAQTKIILDECGYGTTSPEARKLSREIEHILIGAQDDVINVAIQSMVDLREPGLTEKARKATTEVVASLHDELTRAYAKFRAELRQ